VYQRTAQYESDVSFTSSAVRTHAWSIFSGLSLSEVSVISAIALPIYLNEVFNDEWYKDNAIYDANLQVASHGTRSPTSGIVTLLPSHASRKATTAPGLNSWRVPLRVSPRSESGKEESKRKPRSSLFPKRKRRLDDGPVRTKISDSLVENYREQPEPRSHRMVLYKIVVLGDNDAGKTALTIQVSQFIPKRYRGNTHTISS